MNKEIFPIKGFELSALKANIKYADKYDLVLMNWSPDASVAGVYTQNQFCAAPVRIALENHKKKPLCAIINTGYANAGTGQQGFENAKAICSAISKELSLDANQVLPYSTGVIGEQMPLGTILSALPKLKSGLNLKRWEKCAEGIMTTDTKTKISSKKFEYQGKDFHITGISKGAGMIKPNMATMLAFIATNINIEESLLKKLLKKVNEKSFNRITVDGDTSTNDSFLLVATGEAGNKKIEDENSELARLFEKELMSISIELAQKIVRDGEGATKFVSLITDSAKDSKEALSVNYTIAHSPLVKTALFASDPNWGRILACVGRAGVENLEISKVNIWLDDLLIVKNGAVNPEYTEAEGAKVMKQGEITIRTELNRGNVSETVWTTDLSYDYVKINAEYRT